MSGTQQLVGAAGVGLVAANLWTGTQRQQLQPLWTGSGDLSGAHKVAKQVGIELVAVTGLVLIAGTGPGAAGACLAIVAALWLVWLMAAHKGASVQLPNGKWQQWGPYASDGSGLQPGH